MRNGEKIWYCIRTSPDNAEVDTYDKPIEEIVRMPSVFSPIGITVQPQNGYTDRVAYGETSSEYQRIVLTPYQVWHKKFKKGDLFYLDGEYPRENESFNGEYANFMVDNVANQNMSIEISVKKIISK